MVGYPEISGSALATGQRRARRKRAKHFRIRWVDMTRLLERQGRACAYCGRKGMRLTIDHIVPLSKGGRHSIGNICLACNRCNEKKADDLLIVFRRKNWKV